MRVRPSFVWAVLSAVAAWVPAGCGLRIRAVEYVEQTVLEDERTVLQTSRLAEATVVPVKVPWQSKRGPVGFHVELTNTVDGPISFELGQVELRDGFGHLRRPIPPERLFRAFGVDTGSDKPQARTAGYRARHCYYPRHYYRRYYYYHPHRYYWPYYRWSRWWGYGGYGYPWFGIYSDYYYDGDSYYEWRKTARFLAELLESRVLQPNETAAGHVLFSYAPVKDDELTLRIPVRTVPPAPTTQPVEETERVVLMFRFEVR